MMSSPESPVTACAERIAATITADARRTNGPLTKVFFKTFALPAVVLAGVLVAGVSARAFFVTPYNDSLLNTTSSLALFLLMAFFTYQSLRWTERRYHGWRLLRQMFSIPVTLNTLQNSIEATKNGHMSAADLKAVMQNAWRHYVEFTLALGLEAPPEPAPCEPAQ